MSITINFPLSEDHVAGKKEGGQIEIVKGGENCQPMLAIESLHQLMDLELMFDIKKG